MKSVLLIGARGGLGRAVASAFREDKWSVIAIDQSVTAASNDGCHLVSAKSSIEELQQAYLAAVAGAKLNAVINVAGGWAGGSIADTSTAAAAELMLRQSLFSSFAAAHVFSKYGQEGGLLLLTGAAAAVGPTPGMIGYGTAKSAVHFVCQSIASDPATIPPKASVVSILPSVLDTPANRNAMPDADRSTWTPLDDVARQILAWSNGGGRPESGSLVRVVTDSKGTRYIV
ncbi:quinonoid dihydropteridine reductase (QDPR-1) [Leptomonas pyrrhocoris]|uniref:Dihydropteridine reductase n=1 Tax=Leptomonas pyrrhocoris TaxID=157538 RepID=A0A0N0DX62_LEPPY|nr:quinonoid dihydropteridine reductase (QDPR-1) [Leptomonas pyrrhocoris]XP_015661012.1 quinonoid dihydropteridine reductase (QDPR-1) [Leptomonas pyrrhocoris]XP_015661016.1 quinonoid dihydropteridine reductase (QDPR-1) [Leptomonas pyrrhocoris]KPA82572.1 quinonoid dihydropteridine reductase (QDPR-1) [Leptomonas pyrrhocoris]KPA82573.1 quinonoid dihydropteridine reductase (QDPR-1) [Leptomonas pyrrhocoris]KPA82577.1 quinonoid dihydropteridine reductase (QDPR-1) [Leptomonas pyrrhocoris]|eukprot:XP_015661011.1 quinonoid dihydropteridine reductase (QDPR-1) [Leptomonas pyrrhocoris]